jgi:hypothetical protein
MGTKWRSEHLYLSDIQVSEYLTTGAEHPQFPPFTISANFPSQTLVECCGVIGISQQDKYATVLSCNAFKGRIY